MGHNRSFDEAALIYLREQAVYSKDPRTSESSVRVLSRFFGGRQLESIQAAEVQDMVAARLEEGASKATINRNLAGLSRIFSLAVESGVVPTNPVRRVRRFRESVGRTRWLTEAEAQRLLDASPPHLQALIFAAVMTGGRLSELLSLRWCDCDLEGGVLWFRRETTKASKERMIPLEPALADVLRTLGPGAPLSPVFTFRGKPYRSVRTSFRNACAAAGLTDVSFHCLRHTAATWAVQNGLDIYRLQRILGHSDIKLTQRYAHLSPQFIKESVRFLGPPSNDKD